MAEAKSSLARSRGHRALSRPNLLLDADRELVLLTALAAVIMIFVWYAALFGAAVWMVVVAALRMMAKADLLMRRVYIRHISYKNFYRATSSPWRRY
ncbi:conjugal transfer protein TrbD [Rhizobium sp. LjRoot30]|uniref:conjugal transfer protein TrbD n=1 Tax=Rhizobium sp. LjRoot30 TaxID=3342320 RepID=UPI003ECCAC95